MPGGMLVGLDRRTRPLVSSEVRRSLARRLRRAGKWFRARAAGAPTLSLVGDATMRRLNADWAGEDHTTDVLAFPRDGAASAPFADAPLGDIVINWDAVCRQASGRDEAARIAEATALMVHGLAHLHGHDHARRGEGRRMLAVERMILRRLGVADVARPYGGD